MPRRVYNFPDPDRFIAGTLGEPGNRTFYLQAREAGSVITVALEKVQVAALAERLNELLEEVRKGGADVPEAPPAEDRDEAPLEEPVVEAFRVGTLAIVWEGDETSIVVEARALAEVEEGEEPDEFEDDDEGPDVVRVRLEPSRALAFAERAIRLVQAGRPPCPFCGQPLNPEGHICARRNGYMH